MKGLEVGGPDFLDAGFGAHHVAVAGSPKGRGAWPWRRFAGDLGFGAHDVQAVAGVAEEGAAHGLGGALEEMVSVGADAGQLDFAFALEGRGREGRVEQDIGDQVQADGEITGQDFGVEAEAVVAAVAVEAAADRFDVQGDLLGGAGARCP